MDLCDFLISSLCSSTEPLAGEFHRINGFTLIELMVVMSIMSILAAIAVPSFASYRERAQISNVKIDLKFIADELSAELIAGGKLPDSLADINMDHLRDPWGNPYQYLKIEGADKGWKGKARKDRFLVPVNSDFDLYSMGPDGLSVAPFTAKHSRDDIVRASNGGYYGMASNF